MAKKDVATFEETEWGRSLDILNGQPMMSEREVIYAAGINELDPHAIIPLHLHLTDREEYVPQTSGIKILVLTKEEFESLTEAEVKERLDNLEPCKEYDVVKCPKGSAHMAYNASINIAKIIFIKMKEV